MQMAHMTNLQKYLELSILSYGVGNGTPLQCSYLENPTDGGAWQAAVHGVAGSRTRLSDFTFTFHLHALEKEMATQSSVLAWRIPGTGEPCGLQSMGSQSRTQLKRLSSSSILSYMGATLYKVYTIHTHIFISDPMMHKTVIIYGISFPMAQLEFILTVKRKVNFLLSAIVDNLAMPIYPAIKV